MRGLAATRRERPGDPSTSGRVGSAVSAAESSAHALAHAPRPHLRALTGVRFVAALHVVLFHYTGWSRWGSLLGRNLVGSGYIAVSLFFVLSGFILSYTYCGASPPRPIPKPDFYVSRIARIYPVYALGLLLMAPFFVVAHWRTGQMGRMVVEALAVVGLVQSHVPSLAEAWNPPAWSLSTEAFFYLVFPLIAPPLVARSKGFCLGLATACWCFSVGASLLYLRVMPDGIASPGSTVIAPWLHVLKYNPVVRLPEFVIGIVAGRLLLDRAVRDLLTAHAGWLSVALAAGVLAVLMLADRIPYVLLHDGLLAPLFALFVLALAPGKGVLARTLSTRTMTSLGEASYSLYILHIPVGIYLHKAIVVTLGAAVADGPVAMGATIVLAVVASLVCFRTIEVPMRARVRDAFLGRHPSVTPARAPGQSTGA